MVEASERRELDVDSPEAAMRPIQTKLVLLGEAAVGKTSLVHRFVQDDFQENREPTIGAAFLTQRCRLEDRLIKFEIWDTAGQERFHSLAPMYYRNAQASAVASFEKAKLWIKELQRQANPNLVIALVGNKVDLLTTASADTNENTTDSTSPEREIAITDAQTYASENQLLFFETSAKTGEHVLEVFTEIDQERPAQGTQNTSQARNPLVNLQSRSSTGTSARDEGLGGCC